MYCSVVLDVLDLFMDCYNTWFKPHYNEEIVFVASLSVLVPIMHKLIIPLLFWKGFTYKDVILQYFGFFNPEIYN